MESPIALGYLAVSFTFGMMAVQGGLTIWQAVLISMTNLTSAGQFAGLDIIIAGGSLSGIALTQLIINLRYCLIVFFAFPEICGEMSHGGIVMPWRSA